MSPPLYTAGIVLHLVPVMTLLFSSPSESIIAGLRFMSDSIAWAFHRKMCALPCEQDNNCLQNVISKKI